MADTSEPALPPLPPIVKVSVANGADPLAAAAATDAARAAWAEHPWKAAHAAALADDGPGLTVPDADDHEAQCPHGNRFSHCRGCMRAAGLPQKEILRRCAAVDALLHGGPDALERRAEPTARVTAPVPNTTIQNEIAKALALRGGR